MKLLHVLRKLLLLGRGSAVSPEVERMFPKVDPIPVSVEESQSAELRLPLKSPTALRQFLTDHKSEMYLFILSKLKIGIRDNVTEVVLFKLGASNRVAKIKKEDFEKLLSDMMSHFAALEDYDRSIQCRSLLQKHYINRVVDDTKQ
jgi:hypothetical protein